MQILGTWKTVKNVLKMGVLKENINNRIDEGFCYFMGYYGIRRSHGKWWLYFVFRAKIFFMVLETGFLKLKRFLRGFLQLIEYS